MAEYKGAMRIRDQLIEKKKKWSEIMKKVSPLWNINYGTEVLPPLKQEDIDFVCKEKKIYLPEDLQYYLICISKEFFINMYPVEFDLEKIPTKEECMAVQIPDLAIYLTKNKIDFEKLSKVMLKIGDDYENYTAIYVGGGIQNGSVWYYNYNDEIWIRKNDSVVAEAIKELKRNVIPVTDLSNNLINTTDPLTNTTDPLTNTTESLTNTTESLTNTTELLTNIQLNKQLTDMKPMKLLNNSPTSELDLDNYPDSLHL